MEVLPPQQPGNGPEAVKGSLEDAEHQGNTLHPCSILHSCAGSCQWTAVFSEKSEKIYFHLVAENEHVIQQFLITQL